MKTLFITGADGFIGSHLVEKLIKKNYKIKVLCYYNSFGNNGWIDDLNKDQKKKIQIYNGDIRDFNFISNITKNVDCIIHLAALVGIPYSYVSPDSYVQTNIQGTLNILQAAKANKIKKIIITSTSEIYGNARKIPIKETENVNAQSPYAASKIASDQLALSFYYSYNLPVCILRPFNTYGPRQSARAIIPTLITQLKKNNKVFIGNSSPTREFNFIDDTVEGFVKAINNKKIIGKIVNLGNGNDISIKNLAHLIAKLMNKKIIIYSQKSRKRNSSSEIYKLQSSNSLAKKLLRWRPKYEKKNGLINGLKRTILWFSKDENLKKYKYDIYNI